MITQFFTSIVGLLESILKFAFEFIEVSVSAIPKRKEGYNATFSSPAQLLSRREYGFCMTGRRNLSTKNSYQNALISGGTGVGKSSIVLIPSLFTMRGSFIIHDPSGELFSKCSGYLALRGYTILILNFALPDISFGFNPISRANTSSEIQKLASMLVMNALGKGKDPFWNTQATALLVLLISVLKTQDTEYQNLYNVRHLLNLLGGNPKAIDSLFSKYADEVLFNEYKSFIAYDDKTISGIIATCKAALQIFQDESVAKVTSADSFPFSMLREKPVAVFIQNSIADQKYYSVLTSIFFEQCFSYLLGRFPEKNEQDIFLLIDECSSLNLPTLPLAVANVRKHRAGCMLLIQDYNQLVHNYGQYDAAAIKANCFAKLYFTAQSLETSRELEQLMGRYEYKDDQDKKAIRPLMTIDEIRTMKKSEALLICGHHSPMQISLRPFYKIKQMNQWSQIPPAPYVDNCSSVSLDLLPLTSSTHEQKAA